MTKQTTLKLTNLVLSISFLLVGLSGILRITEIIPERFFEYLHVPAGLIMVVSATVHILFNKNWIKKTYLSKGDNVE